MVINIGWLRSGRDDDVLDDIRAVVEGGVPVKVILENAYLTNEEKSRGVGCQSKPVPHLSRHPPDLLLLALQWPTSNSCELA